LASDEAFGKPESVDVARAAQVEVHGTCIGTHTDAILEQACGGRQRVVGRLGAEHQVIDRPRIDVVLLKKFGAGLISQIAGRFVRSGDEALFDPGFFDQFLDVPFRMLGCPHIGRFDLGGKVDRDGTDLSVRHGR